MAQTHRATKRNSSLTALVLQGGGALGAYQGGAFEALVEFDRQPDWLAGISIGAINAAIIAGNPRERRVQRLISFWEQLSDGIPSLLAPSDDGPVRGWANEWSAAWATMFGVPGFFAPRPGATVWQGEMPDPSYYDTAPLAATLRELVDFEYLNRGPTRLSVGAVDVETGNFVYFDNRQQPIGPQHVMASGALPPGFPAIEIDGRAYWDGGLVSNTPLRHVVENLDGGAATIFQVDLFCARGRRPRTLAEVEEREMDIRYSSRTRAVTDMLRERHEMHRRIRALAALLPAERRAQPDVQRVLEGTHEPSIDLVHLILRNRRADTQNKDHEFSRASMRAHWQLGRHDMTRSLRALADAAPERSRAGFRVFDLQPATAKEASK
jgi:NTE family protein